MMLSPYEQSHVVQQKHSLLFCQMSIQTLVLCDQNFQAQKLTGLLRNKLKGAVVLTHDKLVHYWQHVLGNYPYCYGFCKAKGRKFKSVIILNFSMSSLHLSKTSLQNLLLRRVGCNFEAEHPLKKTQLKLLYTGVTQCIERLFIVETKVSVPRCPLTHTGAQQIKLFNKLDQNKKCTSHGSEAGPSKSTMAKARALRDIYVFRNLNKNIDSKMLLQLDC